jgi:hypothetical protein
MSEPEILTAERVRLAAERERMSAAKKWEPAKTIEAVRKELRNAICFSQFGKEFQSPKQCEIQTQGGCAFVEFGVRSGLIEPNEANRWLNSIWDKKGCTPLGLLLIELEPDEEDKIK